jgi:glutamate formiminotransferase/formiminotetrahydrofolate cyclodeaminase
MTERLTELTVRDFAAALATRSPVPGGGSAAALAGAMGAALMHMVVELTAGKPAAEAHERTLAELRLAAATEQSELLRLVELDAAAYDAVIRSRRLPRDTDRDREARRIQVEAATRDATRVPLDTARHAFGILAIAERLVPIGNRNAISDVGVGALLAATAVRGAAHNVRINLPFLPEDDPLRREASAAVDDLLAELPERERAVAAAVEERMA